MKNTQKYNTLESIRKVYDKLAKRWKSKLENEKELYIMNIYYDIQQGRNIRTKADGTLEIVEPRQSLIKIAKEQEHLENEGTLRDIWNAFKSERMSLYYKYNSYMYRRGYSASQYFFNPKNSEIKHNPASSIVDVIVELPPNMSPRARISYTILAISYDFSSDAIISAEMY